MIELITLSHFASCEVLCKRGCCALVFLSLSWCLVDFDSIIFLFILLYFTNSVNEISASQRDHILLTMNPSNNWESLAGISNHIENRAQ